MTLDENKALARRIPEDVATDGNLDVLDEVLADDFVDHAPIGPDLHGIDETKEQIRAFQDAFTDFTATVKDIVAEGDTVAMRVTLTGTHDGEFMGIAPTGNDFTVSNMVFTRIDNGKIVERWTQPDMLGILIQLGALESPIPVHNQ